ncbi:ACP S-malonyltransferase [Clostridioides difficile]|uniref:Malonyl CoA-acyl carrier protein transacylase n=2 Tax=Clostridioides difficile TaxID=1496 RepID=A0AAX3GVY3_CLODI|nr:ACP S-malonyltransferase [Clostridioides difficile]AVD35659.1 [acyl-carrier-protein] S-malonyltransferase [Clostridioides difficile]AVD40895.1 [acyl-carrier-protein] S-malonyltransferase [Clostridioides difficile]AVD44403.1 [acyl-carrier-protein] S-malonyltransferase [Clostridioides difficile]AXU67509.1 malonyl coa-acyl carrier protein transacylase [Clostridioides difficile]AXU89680.1 malonyl coa-acyl carrier protein transacylase [Clostridioides difficile]
MGKVALVFPGQGAQYVGMAKDLYENNTVAKSVIDEASDALNMDLKNLMFNGNEEELSKTENTQPAMVTHSVAVLKAVQAEIDLKYNACLGLSLGEYSALVAADAIDFKDAVCLVKKRGKFMQETVPTGVGAMAAILGLDRNALESVVKDIQGGIVEVANYNSPGQIVISGENEKIEEAIVKCKEAGAKRAVKLNVSGPFHSSMLKEAGVKLASELEKVNMTKPKVDVVANVNADYYKNEGKELLIKQVSSSVLWEDSIERLLNDGYDTFIEMGPGKTLKAFIKKIASNKKANVNIYNIDGIDSLNEFVQNYRNGEI